MTDRVTELQRAILDICRGESAYETWAKVAGAPINERIDWRGDIGRQISVRGLRDEIRAINPNAALYYGWCPGDTNEARLGDEMWFWLRHAAGVSVPDARTTPPHTLMEGE